MSHLPEVLSDFQKFLMQADDTIIPHIVSDDRLNAKERLAVYYDAYRIRLMEVLKLDFEKTHTLLGDDLFEKACLDYLDKFPSTHFSVRYFGQHFIKFLTDEAPYNAHSLTAEMALFEWTVAHTLDASNAPILRTEILSQTNPESWPDLCFTFHPAVQVCAFKWDTPQLWQHIDAEKPPREPIKNPTAVSWLFWRKGIKTLYQSLTPVQAALYEGLSSGKTFGEVCDALCNQFDSDEIPMICAQTLYQWCQDEVLSSCTLTVPV